MAGWPLYQLWFSYTSLDHLLSALWCSAFPGQKVPPSIDLAPSYCQLSEGHGFSHTPALYCNFFDPVTSQLPPASPRGQPELCSLLLSRFASWADEEPESGDHQKAHHWTPPYNPATPIQNRIPGPCLSRLSHYGGGTENAKAISTDDFLFQMYGYDNQPAHTFQ